jgi:hypothetical protein
MLNGIGAEIEAYNFVPRAAQALRHVAAHLAQSNQAKFHRSSLQRLSLFLIFL